MRSAAVLERPAAAEAGVAARPAWRGEALRLIASLAVVALALAVRLPQLDRYATIDESRWVGRSADFAMYLAGRDWDKTFVVGHPGVTTMWLGSLGLGAEQALAFSFLEGQTDVTRRAGYLDALVAARTAVVLATSLALGGMVWLAWGLFGPGPALLGGLLLLLDPFLGAHSRLIHLDALLSSFMGLAALGALAFWGGGSWGYLGLAGLFSGLALLTKAPSVYLIAFVPALAVFETVRQGRWRQPSGLIRLVGGLALWLALVAAVGAALWPYLRIRGLAAIRQMLEFAARNGGGERDNFFLGRPVEDPGPLFYPLALLFRATPLLLVGLLILMWYLATRRQRLPSFWPALLLGGFALGFLLMMTLGQKKFDRYLLPVFPALDLLGGLGLWLGWKAVRGRLGWRSAARRGRPNERRAVASGLGGAVLALAVWPLASVYPYDLAYYNPLLGGGAAAQRVLFVGWGEGLDRVAAYLNAKPLAFEAPTVATAYHRALQAHLRENGALPLERAELADYIVPYVNSMQRDQKSDALAPFIAGQEPEHVVWINGIEYARIYRGPHLPVEQTIGQEFGDRLRLESVVVAPGSGRIRAGDELAVRLRWRQIGESEGLASVLRLVRVEGTSAVQDRQPLGRGLREAGLLVVESRLRLPGTLAPGEYRLEVSLEGAQGGGGPRSLQSLTIQPAVPR